MRIYISDLTVGLIKNINAKSNDFFPNVLYPYAHLGSENSNNELFRLLDNKEIYFSLMVDSGMYVINRMEEEKNIKFDYDNGFIRYCDFIENEKDNIDFYINYDSCFDSDYAKEINSKRQEEMEKIGLKPIYVMHSCSAEEVQYVQERDFKYVAMSSAILNKQGKFNFANDIIEIFYRQGRKVHLLGCASYLKLSQTYAWSCDASSYGRWAGLQKVIFYSEREKKEVTLSLSRLNSKNIENNDYYCSLKMKSRRAEYEDFIYPTLGYLMEDIAGDETGSNLIQANAYYMYTLEKKITEIQKNILGIDFDVW